VIAADGAICIGPGRHPYFGEVGHQEFFWHDAGDHVLQRVDTNVAAHDVGIGAEVVAPEFVAEQDNARAGTILIGGEGAAELKPRYSSIRLANV